MVTSMGRTVGEVPWEMVFIAHSICISLPRQFPLTWLWESAFLIGSTLPLSLPQGLSPLSDLLS